MIAVPLIAGTSYFAMSQGIGLVPTSDHIVNVTRYIDWFLTTPLLLFALSYAMYNNRTERWVFFGIIAALDVTMLATGLGAELTLGNVRTALFSISSLSYLFIIYLVISRLLLLNVVFDDQNLRKSVLILAWIVIGLWSIYPFVWIFGPSGLAVLQTLGEANAYLVLDILTKTGFNIFLLQFLYHEAKQLRKTHG